MTSSWDSAAPATVVSECLLEPISRFTLTLFCGASGDHNPIHVDTDFARAAGHPDVFAHGMLLMAYLGRLLPPPNPAVRVESFTCRFVSITHVGDRLRCIARLRSRERVQGETRIVLDLQASTQTRVVRARATAILLSTVG